MDILNFLIEHIKWIFSGIGVFLLGLILMKKKYSTRMKQKGGKNSTNIQSAGNITITKVSKDDK